MLVTNLTAASPLFYTLSISVRNRTSLKNTLKNHDDVDKWMTHGKRGLFAYTDRLLSHCQRGEAKSEKYILYMDVSYFGKEHHISAPSSVHPSVLLYCPLLLKSI